MGKTVIHRLRVKKYGCLQDVEIPLTALHALIGPNDSGKSTVLRAVRTIIQLSASCFTGDSNSFRPFDPMVNDEKRDFEIDAVIHPIRPSLEYRIQRKGDKLVESLFMEGSRHKSEERAWTEKTRIPIPAVLPGPFQKHVKPLDGSRLLRFDPDVLRKPSHLIPDNELYGVDYFDERGYGLAGILDAVLNRGDDSFTRLVNQLRDLFPVVKKVQLKVLSDNTKGLEVVLTSGVSVRAPFISEGLLFYLGFACVPYLLPTSVLLVEEPENGLHPARIRDVVKVLRRISEQTQVLIATHSPLVVNELAPEEVTVLTRSEGEGTRARSIKEADNFEDRSKVYELGELWLSYANGEDEGPLFKPEKE